MPRYYQDFVGLNTFIYEPVGWKNETPLVIERASMGGFFLILQNEIGTLQDLEIYKNDSFPLDLPTTASFFNALMSHRGNVYGYPTWRQIRVSDNPLTRKQRKNNVFTYVQEPGEIVNKRPSRFGSINVFVEPPVVDSYKPISLVGDVSVYNERQGKFQNRSVDLKTSFGNETVFFANKEVNEYYDTILETDDNYEQLKELYLDGGLEDDGSPIEAFNLLIYRQSVFPKQQYAYLDETRSRKYYENLFWRENREDRRSRGSVRNFGALVPSQSIWPLDAREDFETRTQPSVIPGDLTNFDRIQFDIGGAAADNAESGPGILQNR